MSYGWWKFIHLAGVLQLSAATVTSTWDASSTGTAGPGPGIVPAAAPDTNTTGAIITEPTTKPLPPVQA